MYSPGHKPCEVSWRSLLRLRGFALPLQNAGFRRLATEDANGQRHPEFQMGRPTRRGQWSDYRINSVVLSKKQLTVSVVSD